MKRENTKAHILEKKKKSEKTKKVGPRSPNCNHPGIKRVGHDRGKTHVGGKGGKMVNQF